MTATTSRSHGDEAPGAEPVNRWELIRRAALQLFAVQGYRATTMADIGELSGIRGPSIYRHYESKQQLLVEIVFTTMEDLLTAQADAIAGHDDPAEQLRLATEAHARYHAGHRHEATVGNREIRSVEEPDNAKLLGLRRRYEGGFRQIIQRGVDAGIFDVASPRLVSYAILDMGMGISIWYRQDGPHSEDEIIRDHGEMALRLCRG